MASTAVEVPQESLDTAAEKKKQRLNPARRRAAKLKADEEGQKPPSGTSEVTPNAPVVSQAKTATVAQTTFQSIAAKQTSIVASAPLIRQKTAPLINTSKPNLTRTTTAPPSAKGRNKNSLALTAPAIVTGGLVGCAASAAILLGVGLWYDFSGAEQAILAAKAAKLCVDTLAEDVISSLKAGTYSTDEALDILRRTTLAYASTIPEGAPFVERVFREIDTVRKQRGREVDKIVAETYGLLQRAGKKSASPIEMRTIVVGQLVKLSNFAGNATRDIVARNPNLKPYREGAVKAVQGPPENKAPTLRLNMAVRQKSSPV